MAALALLGACSNVPTAELRVFRESVQTANAAAQPILDEVSVTERRIKQGEVAAVTGPPAFNPRDAAYFADLGDAPAATFLRRGHRVLDSLSEVLFNLATGVDAAADVAAISGLAVQVSGLLGVIGGVSLPVGGAVEVLKAGLEQLSKELQRQEARRIILLVEEQGLVAKLADALTQVTPAAFNVLIRDADRLANSPRTANDVTRQALAARIAKTRTVLSNYVILLTRVKEAWHQAAQATITGSALSTAALTERVAELRSAALATRLAYAALASAN